MRIDELVKKLKNIGVTTSPKTLRRWADQGLMQDHEHIGLGRGRGNAENWPEEIYEEAAAISAIKEVAGKRVSAEKVKEIRTVAQRAFRTPQAQYEWSEDVILTGPNPEGWEGQQYSYHDLEMKPVDDGLFGLFSRLNELHGGLQQLPGDERLVALLDDNQVLAALDRFFERRDSRDLEIILKRLDKIRIAVEPILVKKWIAATIKARNGVLITLPKKVVFHWHSWPSIEERIVFKLGEPTLEELDASESVVTDSDRDTERLDDSQSDEDELLVIVDGIDVRKKVFYAPFDEWNGTELGGELRVLDVYNVYIEVFDRTASLAFTRPERLLTVDEIFEQRAQGYAYLARPEKEIVRYLQSGQLSALELTYNDLLDCVETQGAINKNGWYLASAKIARAVERHPQVVHALFADTSSNI